MGSPPVAVHAPSSASWRMPPSADVRVAAGRVAHGSVLSWRPPVSWRARGGRACRAACPGSRGAAVYQGPPGRVGEGQRGTACGLQQGGRGGGFRDVRAGGLLVQGAAVEESQEAHPGEQYHTQPIGHGRCWHGRGSVAEKRRAALHVAVCQTAGNPAERRAVQP